MNNSEADTEERLNQFYPRSDHLKPESHRVSPGNVLVELLFASLSLEWGGQSADRGNVMNFARADHLHISILPYREALGGITKSMRTFFRIESGVISHGVLAAVNLFGID